MPFFLNGIKRICRHVMDSSQLRDTGGGPSLSRPTVATHPRAGAPLRCPDCHRGDRDAGRSLECMKASPGGPVQQSVKEEDERMQG